MSMESVNPATGLPVRSFAFTPEEKVEWMLRKASAAAKRWRAVTFERRASFLNVATEILLRHQEAFTVPMAEEMGKPVEQGRVEIEKCARAYDYVAEHGAGNHDRTHGQAPVAPDLTDRGISRPQPQFK
jgi:succinate-semialdehyde dehydrogenase / glutarate-semialdehyde dehydrogenase